MPLTLDAVDLWSRFGFGDGDILEIMTDEELTNDQFEQLCDRDPLENLVRLYLVPEIERVTNEPIEIEYINTHHNPMRAKQFDNMPEIMRQISVTVTLAQVMEQCK